MSSDGTSAPDERTFVRRPSHVIASMLAVVVAMLGLATLRRHPDLVQDLYQYGNVLDTHKGSGITLEAMSEGVVRVEVALLVLALAFVARAARTRSGMLAAFGVCAVIYVDSMLRWITTIGGRSYMLIYDDALISMRYARNFADGNGLVYNVGEKVQGYSNLLWTLIMVIPHALGIHEGMTSAFVVACGGVLLIAMLVLAASIFEKEGIPPAIQIVAALAMFFDPSVFEFSVLGLETPLLAFGTALVVAGGLRSRERWIQVGLGLLVLARADGIITAGMLLGWSILEGSATSGRSIFIVAREQWRRIAVVVGVLVAVLLWQLATYGYLFPNTYYLKVYPLSARLGVGLAQYGVRGLIAYGLPAAFVLFAGAYYEEARRARRLLLPVIGVWLYAMYVGGDSFKYLRFLSPMVPILWISVAMAAAAVARRAPRGVPALVGAAMLVVAPIHSERGVLGFTWDRESWVKENVLAAKTIAKNVPEGGTISVFSAGVPYYAPKHRFLDALGKVDSHIGHQTKFWGSLPGHNKFDFAYLYDVRKPDVTWTAMTCDEVEARYAAGTEALVKTTQGMNLFYAPVFQLLDPTFRTLYHPNRVVLRDGDLPLGHMMGCWFVREGSGVPTLWQVAKD